MTENTTPATVAAIAAERFIERSWSEKAGNIRVVAIVERTGTKDALIDTKIVRQEFELPSSPIGLSSFQNHVFRAGLQALFDQAASPKDCDGYGEEAFTKFGDRCADLLADRLPVRGRKSIDGASAMDILALAYSRVSGKALELVKASLANLAATLTPEVYAEKLKAIRLNSAVAAEVARIEAERKAAKAAAKSSEELPDLI